MPRRDAAMHLGAFLYPTGYHIAAWRHPSVPADAGVNFPHFAELARRAEHAKFDFLFLADSAGVRGTDLPALSHTGDRTHRSRRDRDHDLQRAFPHRSQICFA